jgi:uncharacterized protein YecT (DUF1311 family)
LETAALTFVLGIAVSVLGYLLKRWWEGQSTKDSIQETVQLANLHKEFQSGSVTLEILDRLKADIQTRAVKGQKYQTEILEGIGRAAAKADEDSSTHYSPMTQIEMNQYAFHLADLAERELTYIFSALEAYLSESEQIAFKAVQAAWKKYAQKQAELESLEAEGGSMQPLLYASARRLMTIERAAQLKEELNKRSEAAFHDNLAILPTEPPKG